MIKIVTSTCTFFDARRVERVRGRGAQRSILSVHKNTHTHARTLCASANTRATNRITCHRALFNRVCVRVRSQA